MRNFKILLVLASVLFFVNQLCSQEYYYVNGEKWFISKQEGQYVIEFQESSDFTDKKDFLTKYNITFPKEDFRYSNYILCDIPDFNYEKSAVLESDISVNKILNFYNLNESTTKFAILDRIIVGLYEEDPALLFQAASAKLWTLVQDF